MKHLKIKFSKISTLLIAVMLVGTFSLSAQGNSQGKAKGAQNKMSQQAKGKANQAKGKSKR